MSASDVLNVLFLLGVVVFIAWEIRAARKRTRMFVVCGEKLGIQGFKHTNSSLEGRARGLALDVKFIAGSRSTPTHTTIDVACAPCALLLHLRRQTPEEERSVERGETVDLVIGDPVFDAAWIVEGAPAERVTRLLASPSLRERLIAFSRLEGPSVKIEDGKLQLYRKGTDVGDDGIATERIELALDLAEAVIADAATPLAPGEVDVATSDYRTVRRVDTEASAAAGIADLKALRAGRALRDLRIGTILLESVVTLILVGFWLLSDFAVILATPLLFFGGLATAGLIGSYRKELQSAPGVPMDRVAVWWIAATWAVNVAVALRVFLKR